MLRSITLWVTCLSMTLVVLAPAAQALAQPTEYKEVQHPQPGEVKYADKWANVSDLFKQYKDAKQEFAALLDQKKATNDQLAAIQKIFAGIEADYQKAATPVRQQQTQASAKVAQAQQYLTMRPPVRPQDQPIPGYPNRGAYRDDASYNNAVRNHQNYVDQVRRDNQTRQDNYNRQLDQYKKNQQDAKKILDASQAALASCNQQLQQLDATKKSQQQDPAAQKQKVTAEQTAQNQKALASVALTGNLYDAIMTCPDLQRFERGIIDYRKSLYTTDEIQTMLDKAKTDLAASPASTSRQADVDELKILADRAKNAFKGATAAAPKT